MPQILAQNPFRISLARFDKKWKKFLVLKPFLFGENSFDPVKNKIFDIDEFRFHNKESKMIVARRSRQLYEQRYLKPIE